MTVRSFLKARLRISGVIQIAGLSARTPSRAGAVTTSQSDPSIILRPGIARESLVSALLPAPGQSLAGPVFSDCRQHGRCGVPLMMSWAELVLKLCS